VISKHGFGRIYKHRDISITPNLLFPLLFVGSFFFCFALFVFNNVNVNNGGKKRNKDKETTTTIRKKR